MISEKMVQRAASGALAGIVATMAMTMAMRHLHRLLDSRRKYPLPPREIVERTGLADSECNARKSTLIAHFGFGALTGAIFAFLPSSRSGGALYGTGVWALSYLGWIPGAGILAPAWRHPTQRNLLMIAVHLLWGGVLAASLSELEAAEATIFARPTDAEASFSELQEKGTLR